MTHKHAATKRLKEAHNHAAAHGGTCLTTTPIRERANFEFSCPNGHKNFFKRHDSIRQGKYCPACSMELKGKNQIKYTKADLDLHAASRGGSCLSDSYLGWVRIPANSASIPLRKRPPFRFDSGRCSGGKAASC